MPASSNIIWSSVSSELRLGGAPLQLKVSPRAARMRLRIDPRSRAVLLTVPRRVSQRRALAWAAQHEQWVERTLAAIPEAAAIGPGSTIVLAGAPHVLDWDPAAPRRIAVVDGRLLAGGPAEALERRVLRWLKARARTLLEAETRALAATIGVEVKRVAVGDPVSRWGSCSGDGAIRYSWRLIMAPDFVRKATIAHEVAHLVHMNHGPEFHALVEDLLGQDPKPARLWLRREGAGLHRIGRSG
ncbi:MAG TPA: SprT family zinc-dependent metalloprotease [Allosphingosinicella sp.]